MSTASVVVPALVLAAAAALLARSARSGYETANLPEALEELAQTAPRNVVGGIDAGHVATRQAVTDEHWMCPATLRAGGTFESRPCSPNLSSTQVDR